MPGIEDAGTRDLKLVAPALRILEASTSGAYFPRLVFRELANANCPKEMNSDDPNIWQKVTSEIATAS